jgi:glutathione S-transferase
MSDEIVLFHNPQSRSRIARWMLEELGRPYRVELMDYATNLKSPAYLAVNPMGKIPAIKHGDAVVTEAAAVCAYLADAFPDTGLAPALGDPARAPYFRWMFFCAGPLEAAWTTTALGWEVPPEKKRMAGWGSLRDVVDALETAVEGREYIAGDRFTAADVYVGASLGFGLQFGMIEKRPAFVKYAEALQQRPAAIRARQLDDALVAEQQAKAG